MRKIKEVLRLHFETRLSERQISKICVLGNGNGAAFPETGGSSGIELAATAEFG